MKTLISTIEATNGKTGADEFYWKNTNEQRNLSDGIAAAMVNSMTGFSDLAKKAIGKKGVGDLTITLGAVADGQTMPDEVFARVTREELHDVQVKAIKILSDFLAPGKQHAKEKDAKLSKK